MGRPLHFLLGAAALATPGLGAAAPVQPMRWSLHPPSADVVATMVARSLTASADTLASFRAAIAPREIGERADAVAGVRLAPLVSNLLNSRRVSALEDIGVPGSGEAYLRGVHRTIGLALRTPIF